MDNNKKIPAQVIDSLGFLDRRHFLRWSLVAGTAVLSGCASLLGRKDEAVEPGQLPENPEQAEVPSEPGVDMVAQGEPLSDEERAVFAKLVAVLLPVQQAGLPDTTTIPVMANIEGMVREMPKVVRSKLKLATSAFENGSIILSFRFRKFSSLSDEDAIAYVNAWHDGTFVQRGAITSLKVIVCVNYWRDQRAAEVVGYDGPVTRKWGIRRLGNEPLPRA